MSLALVVLVVDLMIIRGQARGADTYRISSARDIAVREVIGLSRKPKCHEGSIYPIYRTSPSTYNIHSAGHTSDFLHPVVSSAAESGFTRTSLSQTQFVCTISHQLQKMPLGSYFPASQPSKLISRKERERRENRLLPPPPRPKKNRFDFTPVTTSHSFNGRASNITPSSGFCS